MTRPKRKQTSFTKQPSSEELLNLKKSNDVEMHVEPNDINMDYDCKSLECKSLENKNKNIKKSLSKKINKNENLEAQNEIENNCSHSNIINNDQGFEICLDCGVQLSLEISQDQEWRYYGESDNKHNSDPSRVQYKKNPEKGIKKDIERLNIPIEVVNKADDYYYEVTKGDIKRSNLRKGIIFACVFQAYKDLNQPKTPDQLMEIFKLKKKQVSKGLTFFRMNCNKESNDENNYITPRNFIPSYLEKFQVTDEHVQIVMDLYSKIEHKSSLINKSNPQSVSCGLVYYYFKKNNIDISASKFGQVVNLSEITIQKIASEIEAIFEREIV